MINRKNPIGNTEKMWYNELNVKIQAGIQPRRFQTK
jgi:hypothetical protein